MAPVRRLSADNPFLAADRRRSSSTSAEHPADQTSSEDYEDDSESVDPDDEMGIAKLKRDEKVQCRL